MPVLQFRMNPEEKSKEEEKQLKIHRVSKNLFDTPVTPEAQQQRQQELDQKLKEVSEQGRQALQKYEIIQQIHPKPDDPPGEEEEAEEEVEEPIVENEV